MYLPCEIKELIWEYYWKDIFTNQVIIEYNSLINYDKQLFNLANNNDLYNISIEKKSNYIKLNSLIEKCFDNKGFKILTKSKFFKNSDCTLIKSFNIKIEDEYKFVLSFMVYYSKYMAMKVYYDFHKIIIKELIS